MTASDPWWEVTPSSDRPRLESRSCRRGEIVTTGAVIGLTMHQLEDARRRFHAWVDAHFDELAKAERDAARDRGRPGPGA